MCDALRLLHAPALKHAVAFPHPSLLQYDCGKLQTLDSLLRRLKAGGHRVLLFTQMTKVLDVLEAFLSLHGHTYLRLDGATRVERRQILVDRFNSDPRIFAFILSTRSGGVGLNLTGADSVVFYDSDWNPTMDAQAQDRCHRIGQTRDVHVYRLDNIKDLFGTEGISGEAADGELESALAAAEDEADAEAARAARAEASTELAEFDETLPLPDDEADSRENNHKPQDEFSSLMQQLTPVEKYAMRMVESSEAASEAERTALGEMQRQLREWEQARAALRTQHDELGDAPAADEPALTYSGEDARTKVRARRRRRRVPPAPAAAHDPAPPAAPAAPAAPAPRTRSRGTVHINLWTLDERGAGAGATRLRNGTLDSWLTRADRTRNDDDNK
ncbi:unnamed protein product [Leptidea sinapis]|uniref:Helicase C-terminal domain-containing protein n=1 Tax=Leptidea sinapis TaxID=189913 RepID=A0A5E4R685_9NEOP|nr:unnamed protein product [Leptidea sinapis]